jgi:hypothetical protein
MKTINFLRRGLVMILILVSMGNVPDVAANGSRRYVSTTGTDSGDCSVNPCATIAYAISKAVNGDTVDIAAGTYNEAGIVVGKKITIQGQGMEDTIVQAHANPGAATDRVFDLDSGTITIRNLAIQHGNSPSSGGGILVGFGVNLTLDHVKIHKNNTTFSGGGIDSTAAGSVTIKNSVISENHADNDGGGIDNFAPLTITNSTIISNTANNAGGIDAGNKHVWIENSTIENNHAQGTYGIGGGILTSAVMTIENSVIENNEATDGGGGIYNFHLLTIMNSTIYSNTSYDNGGGIYTNDSVMTITHSTISANKAIVDSSAWGGGIYIDAKTDAKIFNSTISGNMADGNGGGIFVASSTTDSGNLEISNSTITRNITDYDNNNSGDGGGISTFGYIEYKSTIVAGNDDRSGNSKDDCDEYGLLGGEIYSAGFNLLGAGTGCNTIGSDQTTANPGDDFDLNLTDNGGPTLTHALPIFSSKAIDAGSCTDLDGNPVTDDQRSWWRPVDQNNDRLVQCDVGAYEQQSILMDVDLGAGDDLIYTSPTSDQTVVSVPDDGVSEATSIVYTPLRSSAHPDPMGLQSASHNFVLDAYRSETILPGFVFSQPVTITVHYTDTEVVQFDKETLALYSWNGDEWEDAAQTCDPVSTYTRNPNENWLSVQICQVGEFALFGETNAVFVYLPLIVR